MKIIEGPPILNFPGGSLFETWLVGEAVTIRCPGCEATFSSSLDELAAAGGGAFRHRDKACPVMAKIAIAKRLQKKYGSRGTRVDIIWDEGPPKR